MTDAVCPAGTEFAAAVETVRLGESDVETAAVALIGQLSDRELLGLLDGDQPLLPGLLQMARRYNATPIEAGRVDRLGIPGIRFTDGPRGVVVGASTAFPAAIARAASWDVGLERRVGDAIGAEARAQGANLFAGVCVNLAPAPGWGRTQESYGEDPLLLGAMGSALVEGVRPWVLACVKHYALNSMEEARFTVDVRVDEDVLHDVYLPHFRAAVEAGADAVMSSYNSVNGDWAGQNRHLLTEILREQWGFDGFVMTDFVWGLRDPVGSVAAGQDLEMPFRQQRAVALPRAARDGRLARADVVRAATRLLNAQIRLALRARPTPAADVVASPEHRALAREAAHLGTVLLRNEPVAGRPALPLDDVAWKRVAVLGPLADAANLGDVGSSQVFPPSTVSVVAGLRERLGDGVAHLNGQDLDAAAEAARSASSAVVVVGLDSRDEGESMAAADADAVALFGGPARWRPVANVLAGVVGAVARNQQMGGDRRDLHLHDADVALIEAVASVQPRTVVVVVGGGTIMLDPWDRQVAGILLAWYPGMEGGRAIADVLIGDAEPGGRLPVAIPGRREDLPVVDWHAREVTYGRSWGQRMLDHDGVAAAYPFGFGLGYTAFALADLRLGAVDGDRFAARVTVENTSSRAGRHVVQLYATATGADTEAVAQLVGFQPVHLAAGEQADVVVEGSTRPLQRWTSRGFVAVTRTARVQAAAYAGDPDAVYAELSLP